MTLLSFSTCRAKLTSKAIKAATEAAVDGNTASDCNPRLAPAPLICADQRRSAVMTLDVNH